MKGDIEMDMFEALEDFQTADYAFKQSDMIRKYKQIAEQDGPTAQLLDFINYDGGLAKEIGLENFDNFSTATRHEILLSKLNPDDLDAAAMESLSGSINKFSNWLMAAGAAGTFGSIASFVKNPSSKKLVIAGISYGAGAAASLVKLANVVIAGVYPYARFMKYLSNLEKNLALEKEFAAKLPTTFDLETWSEFDYLLGETDTTTHPGIWARFNLLYGGLGRGRVSVDAAGWTPENFKSTTKKFVELTEAVVKEQESVANKIAKIEAFVTKTSASRDPEDKKVVRTINICMGKSLKLFRTSRSHIDFLGKELNIAGKQFKVADK